MPSPPFRSGISDATIAVPTGASLKRIAVLAGGSGGTIVITHSVEGALDTITVPASAPFGETFTTDPADLDRAEIPGGSTVTLAGMASWYLRFA